MAEPRRGGGDGGERSQEGRCETGERGDGRAALGVSDRESTSDCVTPSRGGGGDHSNLARPGAVLLGGECGSSAKEGTKARGRAPMS